MLFRKQGYPEEGELVLCSVSKVQFHSVFANLDEYGKSGMIHISEVSPGRIRNIRDYVVEGKVIVCKVLKINKEKGYIDLSYRRVNENQRRKKVEEIKQEQKAEKIVEFVSKEMGMKTFDLYKLLSEIILPKFGHLYTAFYEVVDNDLDLSTIGIDKKIATKLEEVIRQRIKPIKVEIRVKLELKTYAPNGIEIIKKTLSESIKGKENTDIKYLGAGKHALTIIADNYEIAEEILDSVVTRIQKDMDNNGGEFKYTKEESKKIN